MGLLFKYEWFLASWASIWFISLSMCFIHTWLFAECSGPPYWAVQAAPAWFIHHVLTQAPNAMVNQRPLGFASPPTWAFLAIGGPQRSTGFPYAPMTYALKNKSLPRHIRMWNTQVRFANQCQYSTIFFCPISHGYCDPNSHGWMMLDVNADLLNKWTIALGGAHILSQSHPLAISWICAQKVNPRGFKVQRNAFLILISAVMVCCLSFTNVPRVRKTYHLHNW